jgi:hypothetical protein
MTVRFRVFTCTYRSWDTLFAEAAAFATELGPDRLIGISHSHEGPVGVVTVWYWEANLPARPTPDLDRC